MSNKQQMKNSNQNNKKKRDKNFYKELNEASEKFLNELIISNDMIDDIYASCKYDLSYTGYNLWIRINNEKNKDDIKINKHTFSRSSFFKNNKFRSNVYSWYDETVPFVKIKFIGPVRNSGDLLLKLIPNS